VVDGQPNHVLNKYKVVGQVDVVAVEVQNVTAQGLSIVAGVNTGKVQNDHIFVNEGAAHCDRFGGRQVESVEVGEHVGGVAPGLYFDITGNAVRADDFAGFEELFFHKQRTSGYRKDLSQRQV